MEVENADLYLCNLADDRGRSGSEILGVYIPAGTADHSVDQWCVSLDYIENRGAAFSLFAQFDSRWIFVVLAIVITVAIFTAIYRNMLQTQLGCWSLILVAAGALGNAIDRVARGFVVDMFDFRLIHFPVFNVADIFICVGGVLFVLYFMLQHKETSEAEK